MCGAYFKGKGIFFRTRYTKFKKGVGSMCTYVFWGYLIGGWGEDSRWSLFSEFLGQAIQN